MIAKDFERKIIGWQDKLEKDEWFFSRLRDELLRDMPPHEVFTEIDDVVDLILRQEDKFLCYETLLLLSEMYRQIETTERPPKLQKGWEKLKAHVSRMGSSHENQFAEFERWFGVQIQ